MGRKEKESGKKVNELNGIKKEKMKTHKIEMTILDNE